MEEQKDAGSSPDLLRVCHDLVKEVVSIGVRYGAPAKEREGEEEGEGSAGKSRSAFLDWQQCYERHDLGMVSTVDGKGRAMWHDKRWAQKGKTKAGPRRPDMKRNKTKSKKPAEADTDGPAQAEDGGGEKEEAEAGESIDASVKDADTAATVKEEKASSASAGKAKKGRMKRKSPESAPAPQKRTRSRRTKAEQLEEAADEGEVLAEEKVAPEDEPLQKTRNRAKRGRQEVQPTTKRSSRRKR